MIRRVTVDALFGPPLYSHASVVEAGTKLAFLAGAVPLDAEGEVVGEKDAVLQTEQVLRNLEEQLLAVGSGLEHVLATSVYVVVAVGITVRDPLAFTADPLSMIVVAFELDHCSVALWPL